MDGKTRAELIKTAIETLTAAGVEGARLDAELLMAETLQCSREAILAHPEKTLTEAQAEQFESSISRRADREPLAYILCRKEFMSLSFRVSPATLIPRPETETLVETAVELVQGGKSAPSNRPPGQIIIDMGTGCGNIAIALARYLRHVTVYACDRSADALAIARQNAADCGVRQEIELREGDLFAALTCGELEGRVNLVVSNPAYVAEDDWARLMPEVKQYEPFSALVAGRDGLLFVRRLIAESLPFLTPGGWLLMEVGARPKGEGVREQAGDVVDLFLENGNYTDISIRKDLQGLDRVVSARKT